MLCRRRVCFSKSSRGARVRTGSIGNVFEPVNPKKDVCSTKRTSRRRSRHASTGRKTTCAIGARAPAPPAGDSCYVGPFLHENLHIRVREASRKLALARHKNVARWLDRWAAELEGESVELTELGTRPRKRSADKRPEKPRETQKHRSRFLRAVTCFTLCAATAAEEAPRARDARARGSASDARICVGWWVRTPNCSTLRPRTKRRTNDETSTAKKSPLRTTTARTATVACGLCSRVSVTGSALASRRA